jgi:hypothetical protein
VSGEVPGRERPEPSGLHQDHPGGPRAPGPRPGPPVGIEVPDGVLAGLPFAALDPGLPLLLLPVRVETRYRLAADPPELRIRIYPDQVHIDADTPTPGRVEAELTREFWRAWLVAGGEAGRQAAWRTFAARVGTQRAGWLARTLRPDLDSKGVPRFPSVEEAGARLPARPVLLPGQWLAVGYSATGLLFSAAGKPVTPGLRTGPDPAATAVDVGGSGLRFDPGLAWMVDYDEAVGVGMAITVPLTGTAAPAIHGVATLLVVGVDAAAHPAAAAAELDRLLGVHARTDGLAFVPQGTPTNNTETVAAGWSAQERDLADLAARELGEPAPVEHDNAARLAGALGLAGSATLRRAAFGTDPERERSRAMVKALFEAIMGTFVRRLLRVAGADGLAPADADALRDWCTRWVTGGAALPTIAVGPQPYGVLPVRRSTPAAQAPPSSVRTGSTTAGQVERIVGLLVDEWRRAAAKLPVLDPEVIDGLPEDEQATSIATILATQPHPARLFTRWVDQYSSIAGTLTGKATPQGWYELFLLGLDPATNPAFGPPYQEIAALYAASIIHGAPTTISEQIAIWQGVSDLLPQYVHDRDLLEQGQGTLGAVISVLRGWQRRGDPVAGLGLRTYHDVLGEVDTELIEARMSAGAREWGEQGVVEADDAGPGAGAADYLADLRTRILAAAQDGTLPPSALGAGFLVSRPLLYQLLDATLHLVPADQRARVAESLDLLATRTAEELDWLLRESLGLGTHRLDAWATSLAAERLERMRDARPTGIQVGAFGWVTGLAPRDGARPSAGFVHAPSMGHAVTAAVLRSGWLAHGGGSPVAVDVSSARVRSATWLFEGVRQGQDLGRLLGAQFERALHELGADDQIRPTRVRVLRATGRPDMSPDDPVDGIELLDLDRSGALGVLPKPVRAAIDALDGAFDAAGDVGLFEAVHQLTGANLARATAMLDAMATGTSAPPELLATRTPRASVPVEHRVVILMAVDEPHPGRGWDPGGERDQLAPALAAWVAGVLPPAGQVGLTVRVGDRALPLTLAELSLGALDALWLAGDDPDRPPAALVTLAAGVAAERGLAGEITMDPAARGPARVSLRELTVLAVELRRAIDGLRVAGPGDLCPAGGEAPADPGDDGPALDAAEDLISAFDRLVDDLSDAVEVGTSAAVAPVVERMARIGLAGGRPPGDMAAAAELLPAAAGRLARVAAVTVDPADRRPGLEARLAALLGGRVPLVAGFTLDGAAVDLTGGVAGELEVDAWLDAAGRVRAELGRLVEAGLLSELLDPTAGLRPAAGQLPGRPWAAMAAPSGPGGCVSVVALSGPGGPPGPGTRAAGLVVDRWSEPVPSRDQDTGVAFQFDAPGARPPQTWLLAVPPDGERWSLGLVLDTLVETLEWAGLRAVGPEDLLAFGRAVPAAFAPGGITPWPAEEEAG